MDRQARTGCTVLVRTREMTGRSQTLPWWLGGGEVKTTENKINWPHCFTCSSSSPRTQACRDAMEYTPARNTKNSNKVRRKAREQVCVTTQSRQSAKLFLQSSELGLPHPFSRRRVCPPTLWSGGREHSPAAKGVGESQFRRGDIRCGALCI